MKIETKLLARAIKILAVVIIIIMIGACGETNPVILCEKPFIHPTYDLTGTK